MEPWQPGGRASDVHPAALPPHDGGGAWPAVGGPYLCDLAPEPAMIEPYYQPLLLSAW